MTARFLTCLALLISLGASGQTRRDFEKAGDKAFAGNDWYAAMAHYQQAIEKGGDDEGLNYKMAESLRQQHAYEKALGYYGKVQVSGNIRQFPLCAYWMGMCQKGLGRYVEAAKLFEQAAADPAAEALQRKKASLEAQACEWALSLKKPADVTITHLDKKINSEYSDFGPQVWGDTLYYSSLRYELESDSHDPKRLFTKLLYSKKEDKAKLVPNLNPGGEVHAANMALSADGRRMYYNLCRYTEGSAIRCQLYLREREKNGAWGRARLLPINLDGYTATQPNIGYDSVARCEVLYFVSDRPGGKGKLDIWRSLLGPDGTPSAPVNVRALNSRENDVSPFFHTPSQTIYFSSDGRQNIGGYDIYRAGLEDGIFDTTQHMGIPLNSSFDDLYFVLNDSATTGYFASNRPGSFFLDKNNQTCCYDLYRAQFQRLRRPEKTEVVKSGPPLISVSNYYAPVPDQPAGPGQKPEPVTPVTGENPHPDPVIPPSSKEPEKQPEPRQPESDLTDLINLLPLALYFDNDEPDKRTRNATTAKTYGQSHAAYQSRRDSFLNNYTQSLDSLGKKQQGQRIHDFFDLEVKGGYDTLLLFSQLLIKRLERGEHIEVFVKGFTSPRAKTDYNLYLSKRRISSIRNHFRAYGNGVFQQYLKNRQLVISEKPFGETVADARVSDDLNDPRNSVFSVEASRERRVEIMEVKKIDK